MRTACLLLLPLLACSDYEFVEKDPRPRPGSHDGIGQDTGAGDDLDDPGGGGGTDDPGDSGDDRDPDDPGYAPDGDPSGDDPTGFVVTILLTLTDDRVPEETARQLIVNAVGWVSPVASPRVLVVLDDAHAGEDEDDAEHIRDWLDDAGISADLTDEPEDGVERAALAGYHVVILSNPGHPPDDRATIEAMRDLSTQGYGILFVGDDMTRFEEWWDNPMEELTRLRSIDNGEEYYGVEIDNDEGDAYAVTLDAGTPLTDGMSDRTFLYGNDIDTSEVVTSATDVVGWCTVQGTSYPEKPVVTAWSP